MAILIFILALAVSFLIDALLIYVITWAFGLTFSWKIAVGIWILLLILKQVFGSND